MVSISCLLIDLGWYDDREMVYIISITQVLFFLKEFVEHSLYFFISFILMK